MDFVGWLVTSTAVLLIGLSKTGFGPGAGVLATPLVALIMSADQAIGVLLPVLCVCDLFSIYFYRNTWNRRALFSLLPGAIVGIAVGGGFLAVGMTSERVLKTGIGIIALLFVAYQTIRSQISASMEAYKPKKWHGWLSGLAAGFTSTVAHAGGPPVVIYLLPQQLGRALFVGTTVFFFAVVNYVKLIPYGSLGLLNVGNLSISLVLLPLVPVGTALGYWLNQHMTDRIFNTIIYILLFLMGLKYTFGIDIGMILRGVGLGA
ncbi:MAG: sulfite exporter TauE/SafE family protein [bacterium]